MTAEGWFNNWKCVRCDRCGNTDELGNCLDDVEWIILEKGKKIVDEADLEFLISEFTNAKFKSDLKQHEKIKNKYNEV